MLFLVSAAFFSFSCTSLALRFVVASTSMSSSSSSRFPVLEVKRCSSDASNASNAFVFWFTSLRTSSNCSSSAFCSFPITKPSSCSSRPSCVTVKSTTHVFAWSSGEKAGLGRRLMKYAMNRGSISIILSDTFTNFFLPRLTYSFSRMGSNMGSITFSTCCTMNAIPSAMANSTWSFSFGWLKVVVPKYGVRSFSRLLIHVSACPCGSTSSGYLDAWVMRIPFWMLRGSVGRPSMFQSAMVAWSTLKLITSRSGVTGTLRVKQSAVNLSFSMYARNSWLNGPQ
mmetsp:Transcript_2515/g.5149  ORF Transcript_2515/g.5149 Transcript_2515/m.5149 type:complete len:283 (-) Transcript_2515:2695-3543(-)